MKKITLFFPVLSLLTFFLLLNTPSQVNAQQVGSNFQANRIIDDSLFYSGNELTPTQIQQFLNARVPACDTNGQKIHSSGQTRAQWAAANNRPLPPYTCLRDYVAPSTPFKSDSGLCAPIPAYNNRSAAQIVDDVARACSVSQKVLLVTLEKEQSLLSDDWPWPVQYEKAMGYYCPDDPTRPGWCAPEYAGFFNQVYNAARQLQRYKQSPNSFNHALGRTSFVSYQANAPSCGGTNLTMQTAATAALYNYTPYQPNAAALNNLYGTGDSCSAYGNRNFWRMYSDWFGSTEGTPFFRIGNAAAVYMLGSNNNYYHVTSSSVLEAYGYPEHIDRIASVNSSYISGRQNSGPLPIIARFEGNAVFLVDRGKRRHFPSRELLENTFGFTMGQEALLPLTSASYFPQYAQMRPIITEHNGPSIHLVNSGQKRHFTEFEALNTGTPTYSSQPKVIVSKTFIDSLPTGSPIFANNRLFRHSDNNTFTFWDGNELTTLNTTVMNALGIKPDFTLPYSLLSDYPAATRTVGKFVRNQAGQKFILDTKKKIQVSSSQALLFGLVDGDFILASNNLLNRATTESFTNLFRIQSSSTIYTISSNELKRLNSWAAINEIGLGLQHLRTINSATASLITNNGKAIFRTGSLVRVGNQPAVFLINTANTKIHVPSVAMLNSYGLSISSTISVSSASLTDYPTVGILGPLARRSSGSLWHIYEGSFRRHLPDSQLVSSLYGINTEDIPLLPDSLITSFKVQPQLDRVIRGINDNRIFYIQDGQKRWVTSTSSLNSLGYSLADVKSVSPQLIQSLPNGSNIN